MSGMIRYATSDRVATLTLHRPQVRNALNAALLRELLGALREAEGDSGVRALILTGSGPAFCAGQDLTVFQQALEVGGAPDVQRLLDETYHPVVRALYGMPKPVIAAVNGPAAGAGMSLALACDLRIMVEDAFFSQAFIRLGLVPDSGSSFFLTRLVGPARAFELAATGRRVFAEDALRLGLAERVVPAGELLPAAQEEASRLAQGPARAIAWTKQLLHEVAGLGLEEALLAEAALQAQAIATADHREGVQAFIAGRRTPRF